MAIKYFFLNEKKLFHSKNKLRGNPRIVKFDPTMFWLKGLSEPTPSFSTVSELVQKDKRFKQFKKERPKTALLLTNEENIINLKDMVLASSRDDSQAGRMLLHVIEGTRASKQFSGIHHLPDPLPDYVINFQIVEQPNHLGVYTATFQIREKDGTILEKENISTLFPKDWSPQKLYDECLVALNKKVKIDGTKASYTSFTLSGIPVEIHFDESEERIRTLYPIRN